MAAAVLFRIAVDIIREISNPDHVDAVAAKRVRGVLTEICSDNMGHTRRPVTQVGPDFRHSSIYAVTEDNRLDFMRRQRRDMKQVEGR